MIGGTVQDYKNGLPESKDNGIILPLSDVQP